MWNHTEISPAWQIGRGNFSRNSTHRMSSGLSFEKQRDSRLLSFSSRSSGRRRRLSDRRVASSLLCGGVICGLVRSFGMSRLREMFSQNRFIQKLRVFCESSMNGMIQSRNPNVQAVDAQKTADQKISQVRLQKLIPGSEREVFVEV